MSGDAGGRSRDEHFREYVLTRRGGLMRQAYLLTGDAQQAEDLVQTALAKAYVSWAKVQSSASPDAYVRRILINTNISWFRRRRVREVLTAATPETAAPAAADSAWDGELIKALNTLPEKQRAVVVLRYWEDLPEAEIAAALGCTVRTVRSHSVAAISLKAEGMEEITQHPTRSVDYDFTAFVSPLTHADYTSTNSGGAPGPSGGDVLSGMDIDGPCNGY